MFLAVTRLNDVPSDQRLHKASEAKRPCFNGPFLVHLTVSKFAGMPNVLPQTTFVTSGPMEEHFGSKAKAEIILMASEGIIFIFKLY